MERLTRSLVLPPGQSLQAVRVGTPGDPFPGVEHHGALLAVQVEVVGQPFRDFLEVFLPAGDGGFESVASYEGDEQGFHLTLGSRAADEFMLPEFVPSEKREKESQ